MTYVFIDTSVWIRVLSQGNPGCEILRVNELKSMLSTGKITLLLPEIVELEIEKNWRDFNDDIIKEIGQLENKIDKATKETWNEIEDIQKSIKQLIKDAKAKKVADAQMHFQSIQDLFSSPNVAKIPFTHEIMLAARKRLIAGRMPIPKNQASNDACIVESLVLFFSPLSSAAYQFVICTANVNDFCLKIDDEYVVHPLIKESLPNAKHAINLSDLVEVSTDFFSTQEPSPSDVQEAIKQLLVQLDENEKVAKCVATDCTREPWCIGPFCFRHFQEHLRSLPSEQRVKFEKLLDSVLQTLTYREKEIFKLRTGFGDGYIYTQRECARIFKCSPSTIGKIEAKALRKLSHPVRVRPFERFF